MLENKKISTQTLKEIYIEYSPKKDLDSKLDKNKASKFINFLFEIYSIPKNTESKVNSSSKIKYINKNY